MIMYKGYQQWKTLLVSISLKELDMLPGQVEKVLHSQIGSNPKELKLWKNIDIIDTQIISSTYQPSRDCTIVDLLVVIHN